MRYLSSKNVAEILGVNISTLKRWTDNGTLECTKTAGGHRKFTMQNIRDFHKSQESSGKNNDLGIDNRDHKKVYSLIFEETSNFGRPNFIFTIRDESRLSIDSIYTCWQNYAVLT